MGWQRIGHDWATQLNWTKALFWASLVAQLVKNPPAMKETPILFLGWEDPLKEDMETHSSVLAWRIPMDRGFWRTTTHGALKSGRQLGTAQHSTGPILLIITLCYYSVLVLIFLIFIFNWLMIALQYWFDFCHTLTWINHSYTYVPSLLNLPPTSRSFLPL